MTTPSNAPRAYVPALDLDKVTRLRITKGFNVTQFGQATGVTRGHMNNVCRGNKAPSPQLLVKMAEVLGVDPAELLAADES